MADGTGIENANDPELRGRAFDAQLARFLSRRGLLRLGAAGAGAAALASVADKTAAARGPMVAPVLGLRQEGSTIVIGLEADPRGIEPAVTYDFTASQVANQISEPLLLIADDGSLLPHLAETFEQPDPLTYVYALREGVTFHDGSTLTAADVLASVERVRNPDIASPMAWMFDPVDTIDATGEMEVTIKLKSPSGQFQFVPAVSAMSVMPKAFIDTLGPEYTREPIGTGPYKIVSWDAGSQIELAKHTEYWQEGKPYFDRALYQIAVEGTTRVTGLSTGDLQVVREIPPDQLSVVRELPNVNLQEVVGYTINLIFMRNDRPPFDDLKVRQAVAHAINTDSIMSNLVGELGVRANSTSVPPNMPDSATDQLEPVPFDLERARQLLAESSQPDGFTTSIIVDSENELRVAEAVAIQEMLAEINVTLEINQVPSADRLTLYQEGEYDGMGFWEWGSDFPDANGMLLPAFHSRNLPPQSNQSFYKNPEVDALLDGADQESDPEVRSQMLIDAQKLIAADQPVIWLDHFKWFLAVDKAFGGYTIRPLYYWDAWLRDLAPVE
jgi:peptide/nickel transport system substrate-binding protein